MTAIEGSADYRTPMWAPVEDVRAIARDWDDDVLMCRTYGHPWQPEMARLMAREGYYAVSQRCPRCKTRKHSELSLKGRVYASWYEYAEGYLTEGVGRIVGEAKDELRLATVTRVFSLAVVKAKRDTETPRSIHTRQGVLADAEQRDAG